MTGDNLLKSLEDGLEHLLQESEQELKLPDSKKMGLGHAITLSNKYSELNKKLEILTFWFETEKNKINRQKQFLKDCCEGFMRNYREQCGSKSLTLPNGCKFGLRKCPDSVEIKDEELAIKWCEENLKEACKIKITLLKTPIMDCIKTTGSIPAGVEFVSSESKGMSFSIS